MFAFDPSLNGSWGLIMGDEKEEIVRFNTNEIILYDQLFRSRDYEEADDTIYIYDLLGDSVILQYYRLSIGKLLFILWNVDNPIESMTLILSRL